MKLPSFITQGPDLVTSLVVAVLAFAVAVLSTWPQPTSVTEESGVYHWRVNICAVSQLPNGSTLLRTPAGTITAAARMSVRVHTGDAVLAIVRHIGPDATEQSHPLPPAEFVVPPQIVASMPGDVKTMREC